ncbi:MAG: hypothetical protein ACYDBW_02780 [Sulfuricaulis sp.]
MPLKIILNISLLRAKPQDLPASGSVMLAALAAYALADVLGVLDLVSPGGAALAAAVDTLLLLAATHLALRWRHMENRAPQTLSALAGCGALISLLAWAAAGLVPARPAAAWVWLPFLFWYTLVFGHILRHALSISRVAGVTVSILYLVLSMGVTGLFIQPVATVN